MTTKGDLALSVPPVSVAGASVFGYSLPEWAAIVTIIYTIFLTVRLIRNEWRDWKAGR
jgi:disulfide bond formation protein DsbB